MQRKSGGLARTIMVLAATLCLSAGVARAQTAAPTAAGSPAADDPWPSLASQIFNGHKLSNGAAVLAIEAPYRAQDAAVVPITIRVLPPTDPGRIRQITLVIDHNPSPLAAIFTLGRDSGIDRISTRVRINDYTDVHAVAEMTDGSLYVATRYVKAAGGCSAPVSEQEANGIPIGTMRFRQFPAAGAHPGLLAEAELMIRHPNYSGMEMDQLTHYYIPAHFVKSVTIWQGDRRLLAIEAGVSLSENPAFRFDYRPNRATSFRAQAIDSKGLTFSGDWPAHAAGT